VDARFVVRLRPAAGDRFEPDDIGDVQVDAFAGGLLDADLPRGLRVRDLELVGPSVAPARPLPSLRAPHVVARPAVTSALADFVPVSAPALPDDARAARTDRLRRMLEEVFVRPPCLGAPDAMRVVVPRTPAERFLSSGVDPDGRVRLGMVASGTAAFAVFAPGTEAAEVEGISVPTALDLASRRVSIRAFGPADDSGRPAHVVLGVEGAFAQAGLLLRRRAGGYVDDTPAAPAAPVRSLRGVEDNLTLDGARATCAYGAVRGPARDAGLWCRTETSTTWRLELRVREGQAITSVFELAPERWAATDRTGAVHLRTGGQWRNVSEATVNAGCRPACAPFDLALPPAASGLGVLGGAQAQLLRLAPDSPGGGLRARAVEALLRRTFVDERPDGAAPLTFTAGTRSPDGRWWLATAQGALFRATGDLSTLERVCLPVDARGRSVSTLAAAPDGRLVLGLGTGRVGLGRWDL
jgi:hypothetical protein